MNILLLTLSSIFGLMPLNRTKRNTFTIVDYGMMFAVPIAYLICFYLIVFENSHGVYKRTGCDSICKLGNALFMYLGCFLYITIYALSLRRRKGFFIIFQRSLNEIDSIIEKCRKLIVEKPKPSTYPYTFYLTWTFVCGIFSYALYYDFTEMYRTMGNTFVVSIMMTAFPYLAGSVVQGQFIYYVSIIIHRFNRINDLFDAINHECDRKNAPLAVFDIESNMKSNTKRVMPLNENKIKETNELSSSDDGDDDDDDTDPNVEEYTNNAEQEVHTTERHTSETNLPDLFKLHDKILSLSVTTNSEYGAQTVPYMTVCFVISIFGIFLETKVIFTVGGKSQLLDYVAQMYVVWSLIMMVVAYLVLRLCCNANGKSKNSAMIVHEIMQKKPAFMLGNDLYYNKMKAFTLQFLHWEGFFQFNGIGLFTLDYTFIFSTVSAATSYLIVLLQFDMTTILKAEGLL